jgi:hypothetical protein
MSRPSTRKKAARKAEQGYVKSPPACINCDHYRPPRFDTNPYDEVPRCGIGGFAVEARAICKLWVNAAGTTKPFHQP